MTVEVASRTVTVKGPRGTLKREFKTSNFAAEVRGKRSMRVDMWFGNRLEKACLRTICTHIENMIKGVTTGFTFKMRFAYAHFPINVTIAKDGGQSVVEVRNFLGERRLRRVKMHEGVSVTRSDNVKDEIVLTGNDLEKVSGSAALIHESVLVRNKDIRKFLDGIYVRCVGATLLLRWGGINDGGDASCLPVSAVTGAHALTYTPIPSRSPTSSHCLQRKGRHRQDRVPDVNNSGGVNNNRFDSLLDRLTAMRRKPLRHVLCVLVCLLDHDEAVSGGVAVRCSWPPPASFGEIDDNAGELMARWSGGDCQGVEA